MHNNMIHVVLDTSIFRSKPRLDSPEFKALGYLAKKECVCIHIPYVVEQEFVSHLSHEHEKKINGTIESLSGLINHQKATELVPELNQSLDKLRENKEELIGETKEVFIEWLDSVGAVRYDFSGTEAKEALNAYFCGSAPLKQPKNRNDIPDSLIYQAVKALHDKHGAYLHFVVNDGNLRGACESDGVTTYKSLSEFIDIDEAKACLKNALIEDNKGTVSQTLMQYASANKGEIIDKIESLLLGDGYRLIYGDSVPGESNEIYVSGVGKPHSLEITDGIDHYGEGLFVLYFTALVEFTYEFAVHRSEAYDLDRKKYYLEFLNDHYFNVETSDEFSFVGRLELEYSSDFGVITTSNELLDALQNPEVTISELEDFEVRLWSL
jgi:PIN domain